MRKSKTRLLGAGLTTGALGAALLAAPTAAFAADLISASPNAGTTGTTVTLTGPALFFTGSTVGVVMTTLSTCPTNYSTTATLPAVSFAGGTPTRVSATSATFVVPTTATLNAGAARVYNICAYTGTTATSTLLHPAGTNLLTYTLTPASTSSAVSGASGGGNTLTITAPTAAPLEAYNTALFTPKTSACPSTYAATTNMTAALTPNSGSTTTGTLTVPIGVAGALSAATAYGICIYSDSAAVSGTTVLDSIIPSYTVSLPEVTLNTAIGGPGSAAPSPAVTVSSTTDFLTGVSAPSALIVANTTACPGVYPADTSAFTSASVLRSANNRAAVMLPAGVTVSVTPYNICIYNGTTAGTSRLIANAAYTAATPPDVTAITPGAGASQGGQTVTITGSNFPTSTGTISATLGGLAMTNVTPVNANTFTAVTPAHAGQNDVALVVKTDTGTDTLAGVFDFLNSVTITPNTASNQNDDVWIDVKGVGFESYTWDTNEYAVVGDTQARVWLLANAGPCSGVATCPQTGYDPDPVGHDWDAGGGPRAECKSVARISGNELFCQLDLNTGHLIETTGLAQVAPADKVVPNGTYSVAVVSNGSPDAVNPSVSVISSGSTFTVADF